MRILSLSLENFRQFFGLQKIEFAVGSKANVTVVHGENGSGKTTLLNAFKWAFYGETDFDDPREILLVCEAQKISAKIDEKLRVVVCVEFEHDGRRYRGERSASFRKLNETDVDQVGESRFSLEYTDDIGGTHVIPNPDVHMSQILPNRLHPYFFFNGERLEKLASTEGSADIQAAIKAIMGLEILERATKHTASVVRGFRKELAEKSGSDLAEVTQKEDALEEKQSTLHKELEDINRNKCETERLLGEVNKKLSEIGPVATYQAERAIHSDEIQRLEESISEFEMKRASLLGKEGFLAFSDEFNFRATQILDDRRRRGELPSKIKSQFLDDLIEADECICGRGLRSDPDALEHVTAYKASGVDSDVEDAFIRTSGVLAAMPSARERLFSALTEIAEGLELARDDRLERLGKIDELTEKIKASGVDDAAALEDKRDVLNQSLGKIGHDESNQLEELERVETELSLVKEERKQLAKQESIEKLAATRHALSEEVHAVLANLEKELSEKVRAELSELVDETFQSIMKKHYWAEISDDYSLRIMKKLGGQIAEVKNKSSGESLVTSLSFIGGLVSLARKRSQGGAAYYKGGIFPIVMDSPTALDPEYKKKISEAIPRLAEQVVIFVSNTLWRDTGESALDLRKGREYTLISHVTKKKGDTVTTSIVGGAEFEYTEIREGYYE